MIKEICGEILLKIFKKLFKMEKSLFFLFENEMVCGLERYIFNVSCCLHHLIIFKFQFFFVYKKL